MAGPDARAEFTVRDDGHGVEIIIDGSDYLAKWVTTKGNVGFHGLLSFQRAPNEGSDEVECCGQGQDCVLVAPRGPIYWTPPNGSRFPEYGRKSRRVNRVQY